jgi:nucleoside-diphosphate-sugar epimerase
MILVTGATGTVGRQVVEQLVAAGQPVRAVARDPDQTGVPDGVELVAGDLSDVIGLAPHPDFARSALDVWAGFVTEPELVTTTVAEVTGEPARAFRDWAAEHADDFR